MKRPSQSPSNKNKFTQKHKQKAKSKSKQKKFNPLEYLNSLIEDLHQLPCHTVRKRTLSATKRELSSALAYTTPITERTVTSSKNRSKSAYSQFRKKSITMKDILKVDLNEVITEEDNLIHFTEQTVQSTRQTPSRLTLPSIALTPAAAARRIQRAWRNFQTLKVVKKYYEYYHQVLKKTQIKKQAAIAVKVDKISKPQFQRTLKIKSIINKNKQLPENQNQSPKFSLSVFSQNTTKQLVRDIRSPQLGQSKTIELQGGLQSKTISDQYTPRDLYQIIDLFRNSQDVASRELDQQLQNYCRIQAQLSPLSSSSQNSSLSQLSSFIKSKNYDEKDDRQLKGGFTPVIFQQMERVIKDKYDLLLEQAQKLQRQQNLNQDQARRKFQQLKGRVQRQLRSIKQCKNDYENSMRILKQGMMKLQVDSFQVEKMSQMLGKGSPTRSRVRKCFSSDTLILKSILQQINVKNIDIELRNTYKRPQMVFELQVKRQQQKNEEIVLNHVCPTSPPTIRQLRTPNNSNIPNYSQQSFNCIQLNSSDKLRQQIYNTSNFTDQYSSKDDQIRSQFRIQQLDSIDSVIMSLKQQSNLDASVVMMKQCSEELQARIQEFLIKEIVEEIYLDNKTYTAFKPFIQRPFEFKTIKDQDIFDFLQKQLPKHFPSFQIILQKFNQKINPSSLQILRLIRDYQFEIDQYELVLPQQVFKNYRKALEQSYSKLITQASVMPVIDFSVFSSDLAKLLKERISQRQAKVCKFLSFQRDLKIMYMKSVFNCYNELIIEIKTYNTYMNGRSSIGPGQLVLAIKQYNLISDQENCLKMIDQARQKICRTVNTKCMLPVFKTYKQVQQFQSQINKQLNQEMTQCEFKWVNYMDQMLQMWQQLSVMIIDQLTVQAVREIYKFV